MSTERSLAKLDLDALSAASRSVALIQRAASGAGYALSIDSFEEILMSTNPGDTSESSSVALPRVKRKEA